MASNPSGKGRDASPARRLTIAHIARRAGVSVPTVSKVVNGRKDVSAQTRRHVEAVIREQGYRPARRAARSAPLLEFAFHEFESEWAGELIKGAQRVAAQHDLGLVLSDLGESSTKGRGWIETVLARRPRGVVAVLSDLDDRLRGQLRTRGIPLVVIDPTGEPLHNTPSVGAANWSGGLTATRHLLALGHRRIGVIAGPRTLLCSRARLDGYRTAMDSAGIDVDPALIRYGNFYVPEAIREGRVLLDCDPSTRPTAIFALNDLQALGVYLAARDLGLHIPDDLSVIGFDDTPTARWANPPLTTIRQPLVQMAIAAAEMVLRLAAGEQPAETRVELATELVTRSSTAPLRP
ncbi:MAG: LacI family DNA-binding transcriptional regulator [Candidatus Limnocylindrales bacterium]